MGQVFIKSESEQVQSERQNHEHSADPLGGAGDLGILGLGLVLAQEGLAGTADRGGQAGVLTGLEQNSQDQGQAAQQLQDSNENEHRKPHPKASNAP